VIQLMFGTLTVYKLYRKYYYN